DGRAVVTYAELAEASDIITAHERAGPPTPPVHGGERIYTELVSEPHRAHSAETLSPLVLFGAHARRLDRTRGAPRRRRRRAWRHPPLLRRRVPQPGRLALGHHRREPSSQLPRGDHHVRRRFPWLLRTRHAHLPRH